MSGVVAVGREASDRQNRASQMAQVGARIVHDDKADDLHADMIREGGEVAGDEIISTKRKTCLSEFVFARWVRRTQFRNQYAIESSARPLREIPNDDVLLCSI